MAEINKNKKIMKEYSDALRLLANKIDEYQKKGLIVTGKYSMENTGITEIPPQDGWRRHVNLDGFNFFIHLSFPNIKTLTEVMQEDHENNN